MHRITWAMALIAGLLSAAFSTTVAAQDVSLESGAEPGARLPELVADAEFFGIDLAFDGDGHRHVVASQVAQDDKETKDVFEGLRRDLWYATDRDGHWRAQTLLVGDAKTALGWTDPSIAVDLDGRVHIAVVHDHVGSTPGQTEGIYYLTDKDRAPGDFGEPARVARASMNDPSLAVVDGVRYLAYSKLARLGEPVPPAPVFVKTDLSGSWTTHRLDDFGNSPKLAVDASGGVHIVYQGATDDGRRAFLSYARLDPETGEPTKSRRIPGTGDVWYQADLALDPAGRPHVTWETEKDIMWTRRTTHGWSHAEHLGVRRYDWQSLVVDPFGQPHVVFSGRGAADAGRGIIHAQRGAATWPQAAVVDGVGWAQVTSAMFGSDLAIVWAPSGSGGGLWALGPITTADADAVRAHMALEDLLASVPFGGCTPFTEHGANDPFSFGAQAATRCAEPVRGVQQAALFRFPDVQPLTDYWQWRVRQIEPELAAREGACADGRRGLTTWAHGQLACFVAQPSKEAKLRWTDERTGTYGVLDATDRDLARLHTVWATLVAEGEEEGGAVAG